MDVTVISHTHTHTHTAWRIEISRLTKLVVQ